MRLVLILAGFFLVIFLIKRTLARREQSSAKAHGSSQATNHHSAVNMVECRHCHVHLAQTEALQRGNDFYCGADHLHLHHPPRST